MAEEARAEPDPHQQQQALEKLQQPMYKPLMERYILDEL